MPFHNEPPIDFTQPENQKKFQEILQKVEAPFRAAREQIRLATISETEKSIQAAQQSFDIWSKRDIEERARIFFRAADLIRKQRFELAALILLEVHKTRSEADADVCEAIDFLEYYGREALRITQERPIKPLGVVAVIAPWNFPLAILTGMTAAPLVMGNTVIMKPAEQSPVIAKKLFEIFQKAGLPEGVLHFLPGQGEIVGNCLVRSPQVAMVSFTGSKEVGSQIASLKERVISEVGGKNAIIVDETADINQAVEGAILSAFGYQGQKCSACSRIILLPEIYDIFKKKFLNAVSQIKIGDPKDSENFMGPVIDKEAFEKINDYIDLGKKEANLLYERKVPRDAHFVSPTIFENVSPKSRLAQEEIFGPVVCLLKANDLDEALKIANGVPYDLTGGFFSQDRARIERIKKEFNVGNLYINRKITGALVECQPFGGYRFSSLGFKAGGPEYLYQFIQSDRSIQPPVHRELPSALFQPNDRNELIYRKEESRWLSKTIATRI